MTTSTITRPEPPAATGAIIARRVSNNNQRWNYIILAGVALIGAVLPFLLPPAELSIAMRIIIFALMGIGWNMMSGFGGMFSFGHAAYFGIGAYTTAFLVVDLGISPWVGMIAGMAFASLAAVGISYLALRYRLTGAYYALSTFAFAEMLRLFVMGSGPLNRTVGFTVPVLQGDNWAMFQFRAGSPIYFWIGTAFLVLALAVTIVFLRSRTGRFTIAVRDDEMAAAAIGIPVLRHKLTVVAISAAITAVAGTLYLQFYMFVDPEIAFGHAASNNAIITAVVGGVGTLWGPVLGAVIVAPLSDLVTALLRNPPEWLSFLEGQSGLDILLYAIILIACVILLPKGIVGTMLGRRRK
ncbi:branched-chain amino acid ABC transporter permease [Leucobacter aridicollis]|uniref:Branched-chain amino acid transport system permease protein n=1 Tax=Leucobacter aridicollis TaxID=283878 RepID=A0A852R3X2_9MICO|nr:branched-chain amino acid ABC transporter permease [Leucobacter aridicollis]MBL3682254.1 branched-chain amino acid ABC transporter permease [Leucobacter aridicollis]NYD25668.1 branched-chain amino acid transport system permease protein [Leucobacter aridicollis]